MANFNSHVRDWRSKESTRIVREAQNKRLGGGGPTTGWVRNNKATGMSISSDLDKIVKWIDKLQIIMNDPSIMATPVRSMGRFYGQNFAGEGIMLGRKWQRLAPMTREVRKERGYGETGPILVQSGQLRVMAADIFAGWSLTNKRSAHWSDDGALTYENDGPTSMTATMTPREFTATMSGPKVQHMSKQYLSVRFNSADRETPGRFGEGFQPTRPFWGFTGGMVAIMTEGLADKIMNNWESLGSGIGRTKSYRWTRP